MKIKAALSDFSNTPFNKSESKNTSEALSCIKSFSKNLKDFQKLKAFMVIYIAFIMLFITFLETLYAVTFKYALAKQQMFEGKYITFEDKPNNVLAETDSTVNTGFVGSQVLPNFVVGNIKINGENSSIYQTGGANKSLGREEDPWTSIFAKNFTLDKKGDLSLKGQLFVNKKVILDSSLKIRDDLKVQDDATLGSSSSDELKIKASVTFSSFLSNGGVLYTDDSGVLKQTALGTSAQVLHGGAAPSFGEVVLGIETSGDYVASITAGLGLSGSGSGEGSTPTLTIDVTTTGVTSTTSSNSGLEVTSEGLRLLGGCSDGQALAWSSLSSVWICSSVGGGGGGDITTVGDVLSGTAFSQTAGADGTTLYFEGSTSDANEIALTSADPGADITITIPNIAGTLASLAGTQTFTGNKTFSGTSTFDGTSTFNTDTNLILAGTENLAVTSDLVGDVDVVSIIGTPSSTSGIAQALFIQQGDSSNSNGIDAAFVVDNADADLAITNAILITNSGGGSYTNILNSPTLDISAAGVITGATGIASSGSITFSTFTTNGGLLYTNGSGAVSQTGAGSATTVLHGGTSPSYSAVSLTADVTGTLPVGNGGTGATSLVDLITLGTHTTGNYVATITAGAGLTGTVTSEGSTPTLDIGAGNGITVNADDITIDASTTGTTSTTASNSGLEVTSSGLKIIGGCSDTQFLSWNSSASAWTCTTPSTADITAVGDVTSGAAFTQTVGADGTTLYFEGSTSDANEIALTSADPGADITVTLPNIAGTLASLAGTQTFTGSKSFSATVDVSDLTCTDCLDFAEFEDTLDLDAALTLNQTTNTWSQTYTGTSGAGLTYTASGAITSGNAAIDFQTTNTSTTIPALMISNAGTGFSLRINDDGTTTDTSAFVVNASGNVGIGTTTPATNMALDVNGRVQINLGGTQTSTALCGSHANLGGASVSDVEIVDCTGLPAADYMEMYSVEKGIDVGDIVTPSNTYITTKDGERVAKLTKTTISYQKSLIGIVSDKSKATDFNSIGYNIPDKDNPQPIALNGRVYVNMSSSSDSVKPGDYITASMDPGLGMKANKRGVVVGKALESWDSESDKSKVMVFVNVAYYDPSFDLLVDTKGNISNEVSKTNNLKGEKYVSFEELSKLKADISNMKDNIEKSSFKESSESAISLKLVENDLTIKGKTKLSDIELSGVLSIGDLKLGEEKGTINSTGKLKIQSVDGSDDIEFFSGKMEFTKEGNIKTDIITAKKVNINTKEEDSKSLGTVTIKAGDTEAIVETSALSSDSLIFLTAKNKAVSVAYKIEDEDKFIVLISEKLDSDLKINWWVIN